MERASMTLISLFMTNTGIFCFVPIWHRLVESGIIPTASSAWFFLFPIHTDYYDQRTGDMQFLLPTPVCGDEGGSIQWSDLKEKKQHRHYRHLQVRLRLQDAIYSSRADGILTVDHQQPAPPPHADEWDGDVMTNTIVAPSLKHPYPNSSPNTPIPTPCLSQSDSPCVDTFDPHEFKSVTSLGGCTLCDHCDTLLRSEIPADHIPSVVRAIALFEAQDRLSVSVSTSDVKVRFDEGEIFALTDAFSMLKL